MKIALDTNPRFTGQAGVARYITNLAAALRSFDEERVDVQDVAWPVFNLEYRQPLRALKTLYREVIWARWFAPRVLLALDPDIYHDCSTLPVPHLPGVQRVVTVYDLAVFTHPHRFRAWQRMTGMFRLRRAVKADRVICISHFTATECMRHLGVSAKRIEVAALGSTYAGSPMIARQPDVSIPDSFFLYVGSIEPGKNLGLLVDVYLHAEKSGRSIPPLVVVGSRRLGVAREDSSSPRWQYLGHQSDDVLLWLYQHALALVFPSQYEGFGLPVLEAMSVGCPVICSPLASIPEVGGDAVRYAAQDPIEYGQAMREMAEDTACRTEWIARGFDRARQFSWEKCAKTTIQTYHSILTASS